MEGPPGDAVIIHSGRRYTRVRYGRFQYLRNDAGRGPRLVQTDTAGLIDLFAAKGECDLVAEFCEQVPLQAICHVLGFDPEHKADIRRLSGELLASLKELVRLHKAIADFSELATAPVLARRGKDGEDFLTFTRCYDDRSCASG